MTARARAGSLLLLVAIGACGSPHAAPSREPTRGRSTPPRAHEADRGSTTDAAARRDADADADTNVRWQAELACRKTCSAKPNKMCETFKRHRSPQTEGYEQACSGPFERCVAACMKH